MLHKSDLTVFSELHIVTIRGYEPNRVFAVDDDGQRHDVTENDPPGTANWFCENHEFEYDLDGVSDGSTGMLWTDYDFPNTWDFSVLVTKAGLESLQRFINEQEGEDEYKYKVLSISELDTATQYGDGNGVLVIMKHPEGFVIAE